MTKSLMSLALLGSLSLMMAADGASVYKKCIACHGPTGKTVYAGKVPALAGQEQATLVEKLHGYKAGNQNSYGMGAVMGAQAKIHLKSDEDVTAVAEYISKLPK